MPSLLGGQLAMEHGIKMPAAIRSETTTLRDKGPPARLPCEICGLGISLFDLRKERLP